MDLYVDKYAYLNTAIHRWDPRYKLVSLMTLVFSFSFVQDIRMIPMMLGISAILYTLSRLPYSYLLSRLRLPGIFMLATLVILPFMSGKEVLFQAGPLSIKVEGCLVALLIACKFVSILTLGIVLFGTTPFITTVKAMRSLGLPPLLADMTLFAYRYLFDIGADFKTMQTAMGLRGFRGGLKSMGTLSSLAGTILVRSYEQSDRVFKAMIMRGYGQTVSYREDFQASYQRGLAGLVASLLVAASFVAVQLLLKDILEVLI
ncbi:hypothetical protein N752_06185 [Desulforamulus aquiferis]|nr:cobalt ECF transporter T component CbiQ [Desulforamulus aquiferis]RYD06115.1 hypothetical protein N752_06185 [Desulforamulus aquiferis]